MYVRKERNINEVDLLKKCGNAKKDACKLVFKEMEDISTKTEVCLCFYYHLLQDGFQYI